MKCNPKGLNTQQSGFALLGVVLFFMLAMGAVVTGMKSDLFTDSRLNPTRMEAKEIALDEATGKLKSFYMANSNQFAAASLPNGWDEGEILALAGIERRGAFNFRLGVTSTLSNGRVRWRDLYLWIPPDTRADQSVFTPSSGLEPDTQALVSVIEGRRIEEAKYSDAVAQLERAASAIRSMFRANQAQDPFKNTGVNYFANYPCGQRPNYLQNLNTISCSGTLAGSFSELRNLGVKVSTGLTDNDLTSPWNTALEASNVEGSFSAGGKTYTINAKGAPPYTIALRIRTPLGYPIVRMVVQPF